MEYKTVATNRKAFHNFFIEDKFEAGIVLTGREIKSLRGSRVSLGEAYIKPERGELFLVNAHIAPYEKSGQTGLEPTRPRKLLLHRKEIGFLTSRIKEKGFSLVPTRIYIKKHLAKVEIGLARGKKLFDKRQVIARREEEREINRRTKQKIYRKI
jgi:SsrA-binding protein